MVKFTHTRRYKNVSFYLPFYKHETFAPLVFDTCHFFPNTALSQRKFKPPKIRRKNVI